MRSFAALRLALRTFPVRLHDGLGLTRWPQENKERNAGTETTDTAKKWCMPPRSGCAGKADAPGHWGWMPVQTVRLHLAFLLLPCCAPETNPHWSCHGFVDDSMITRPSAQAKIQTNKTADKTACARCRQLFHVSGKGERAWFLLRGPQAHLPDLAVVCDVPVSVRRDEAEAVSAACVGVRCVRQSVGEENRAATLQRQADRLPTQLPRSCLDLLVAQPVVKPDLFLKLVVRHL